MYNDVHQTFKIIDSLGTNYSILVYPNPNNGQFTLEFSETNQNILVEVFDIMGKKVYSKNSSVSINQINIAEQPKGIYLVKVTANNQVFTEKIIYQ
jgi:hypothetical protein